MQAIFIVWCLIGKTAHVIGVDNSSFKLSIDDALKSATKEIMNADR